MSKTLLQFAREIRLYRKAAWEAYNADNEACMVFDRKSVIELARSLACVINRLILEVRFVPPGR